MNHFLQDVRYGIRMLLNRPGFTAAAVLVLALGIGANSAVFSLVNAFLLKPLYLEKAEELTGLYSHDIKHPDNYRAFSYPNYVDIRNSNPVFRSLMAHTVAMVGLKEGANTRRVFSGVISSNYFATLGVPLLKGRAFLPEEEKPGGALTAILTYPFWTKSGQDPEILGKQLYINGHPFTIVGITPRGFSGTTALVSPEMFVNLGSYDMVMNDFEGHGKALAARDNPSLIVVGRLMPGLTQTAADAKLAVIASQMEKAFPAENKDQMLLVRPLSRTSISTNPTDDSSMRVPAILLLSLAAVVLLIASLNLANMMMAKGAARRKEIAIRLAIGGARGRIVRQLVTEGLTLAVLGGAAGMLVASWSTSVLMGSMARLAPLQLVYDATPDARVLAVTLGFCVLSTIIFGLFPAWKLAQPDVWIDLKNNSAEDAQVGSRRLFSRGNVLVMAQLSLSLMMLTAAGLFVHSAVRASNIEPGFALDSEIIAELDPSLINYKEVRGRQVYASIRDRLRQVPGVQSVSMAATVPFGMMSLGKSITPAGVTPSKEHPAVGARLNIVTDQYFETLGIPVLRGRSFLASEGAVAAKTHVAILDKLAANKLWPGGDAVGKSIRLDEGGSGGGMISVDGEVKHAEDILVVGVVGDVRESILRGAMEPHVYIPFGQEYQANMQVHLKVSGGGPEAEGRMLEAVRQAIRSVDDQMPVLALKTMRGHLDSGIDIWVVRMGARILEIFGSVALFLAVIGLYAVNAYTVARRTREIGIRMALGADAASTLRMVLSEGIRVTAIGIGAGLVLAIGVGKVLGGMLYGVPAFDPLVLAIAPVALAIVALFASFLPARRAAQVDPMIALRYE